jgi:ribose transport system substrate-binding protein
MRASLWVNKGQEDLLKVSGSPNDIGNKGVRIAVEYLKAGQEPTNKQVTIGFTTVTRENLNKPEVQKYLYKAEC